MPLKMVHLKVKPAAAVPAANKQLEVAGALTEVMPLVEVKVLTLLLSVLLKYKKGRVMMIMPLIEASCLW